MVHVEVGLHKVVGKRAGGPVDGKEKRLHVSDRCRPARVYSRAYSGIGGTLAGTGETGCRGE